MERSERFDRSYRRLRQSRSHADLMGAGLPEAVQPFSFVPIEGMREVAPLLGKQNAPSRFPRDLRRLLQDAGLAVERYAERPSWLDRQLDIDRRAADVHDPDPAVQDLAEEGRKWPSLYESVRRVVLRGQLPTNAAPGPVR